MVKLILNIEQTFPDEILKISTYLKDGVEIKNYDKKIFKIFTNWFNLLKNEGIKTFDLDVDVIFKPDFFKVYDEETLKNILKFADENEIKILSNTIKYILGDLENFVINYTNYIDTLTNENIYRNKPIEKNIEFVVVPLNVRTIEYRAFCDSDLKNICMHDNIYSIEDYAFYNTKIQKIKIPENVYIIKSFTFANCKNLKTVILPNSLIKIENNAFENCDLKTIGYYDESKILKEGLPETIVENYGLEIV